MPRQAVIFLRFAHAYFTRPGAWKKHRFGTRRLVELSSLLQDSIRDDLGSGSSQTITTLLFLETSVSGDVTSDLRFLECRCDDLR